MTLAFSSSSPVSGFAAFDEPGALIGSGEFETSNRSSGSLLIGLETWLGSSGMAMSDVRLLVADVGPGSFTGVRVATTLAKSMALALGVPCAGVASFDLIDPDGAVVVPARKGTWFLRVPGKEPKLIDGMPEFPISGYGPGIEQPRYPLPVRLLGRMQTLVPAAPELLLPCYLAEPSISTPKRPFRTLAQGGADG